MQIKPIEERFGLTQNDYEAMQSIQDDLPSLINFSIDLLLNKHLLSDPKLSPFFNNIEVNHFTSLVTEFILHVLVRPLDESTIKRIKYVGHVHYSINLEPIDQQYAFSLIQSLLYELTEINELVRQHLPIFMKFFRLIEFFMLESYYEHKTSQQADEYSELKSFNFLEEISQAIVGHKHNNNLLTTYLNYPTAENLEHLHSIKYNHTECSFGKHLQNISEHEHFLQEFNVDITTINKLHEAWHKAFQRFMESNDKQPVYEEIQRISWQLFPKIEAPLEAIANTTFLTVDSIAKANAMVVNLLFSKEFSKTNTSPIPELINSVKLIFEDSLGWAIDRLVIDKHTIFYTHFDVSKSIYLKSETIFIGIKLKRSKHLTHIVTFLNSLLEIVKTYFVMKEREQTFKHSADKAESANKSKDMFLANMSHELRTPLNAITGFSQILLMKPDVPEITKTYIEKINVSGNNLLSLVNTILDFAKLEANKMHFDPRHENLSEILNEVFTVIEPLAEKKSIHLNFPKVLSLVMFVDKQLIKQVLINLFSNAIKFSDDNTEVFLQVTYDTNRRSYVLAVHDQGIGIAKDDLERLFHAFEQLENAYTKSKQGTGLGLMISKKIVEELHKGDIWVSSEVGEGSTFYFSIPIKEDQSEILKINNAPKDAGHVLVVEDSPSYQNILINCLQDMKHLTVTNTIEAAKEVLMNESFDYIILDFFLHDGISSELLLYLEEKQLDLPVVMISAEDDNEIVAHLEEHKIAIHAILNKSDITHICDFLSRGQHER